MKRLLLILMALWLITSTIFSQTTREDAKKIMGDKFIEIDSALAVWKNLDSSIQPIDIQISIPYSRATLKDYALKNKKLEGRYFLVPTLGLSRETIKRFWNFGDQKDIGKSRTEITYRLINLAFPKGEKSEAITSYSEQLDTLTAAHGQIVPMLDYLEALASLTLIKKNPDFSSQLKFFYISEVASPDKMIVYSTLISDSLHEVVLINFPQTDFLTGYINKDFAYYYAGANLDQVVNAVVDIQGLKPQEEKEFFITTNCQIKP